MQLALQLIALAQVLVNLVVANPNLPNAQVYLNQASTAIQTALVEINSTPIVITSSPSLSQATTPQNFGTISTTTNLIPNTMPELTCTLTAESNVGAPNSFIKVSWTSNADKAHIANDRIMYPQENLSDGRNGIEPNYTLTLSPATEGSRLIQISSESGELNKLVATFTRGVETKTCEVDVMTQ